MAAAVISKKVISRPWLISSTSSSSDTSASSEIGLPPRRMRSWKRTRCGEVWTCTFSPCASSMARAKAQAEPLPLVPATWITGGSFRCGLPREASSRRMRSSARSIFLGCSARRRLSTASLRVVSDSILGNSGDAIAGTPRHGQDLAARLFLLHQHVQDARQGGAHFLPVRDHVQHAVFQEIFGALETIGQLLADGLGDD